VFSLSLLLLASCNVGHGTCWTVSVSSCAAVWFAFTHLYVSLWGVGFPGCRLDSTLKNCNAFDLLLLICFHLLLLVGSKLQAHATIQQGDRFLAIIFTQITNYPCHLPVLSRKLKALKSDFLTWNSCPLVQKAPLKQNHSHGRNHLFYFTKLAW